MASSSWLLLLAIVLVVQIKGTVAFGAGNIPSYSYLEGKAFRHGDIEDILSEIAKGSGGAAGLLGAMTGGLLTKKFGDLDVKRIYFGNWLRDYSQAMDVAGLSKLSRQAILNLVMVLGFLAHGYATGEFEVTEERLGVYLPTEHIDNPKDYNENQDARTIHPKLRGPIDPQELEIDPQTGMLNYIANENGRWDTSKALIRRTLLACIDMGRRAKAGQGSAAEYEAYRLLGSALHTLEDFSAHSNYCELTLRKLGYNNVFCHVGENVFIQSPNGQRVPPLVTGTFGGADFIHSLLGEAGDHISSASVSDLQKAVDDAKTSPGDRGIDGMRDLLFQLPNGEGQNLSREMDDVSNMRASSQDPMNMSPQELHAAAWKVLTFRDNVAKAISNTIERIPGLGSLIDKIGDSLARFVFVTLDPYLKPIMKQATAALSQGSAQVVNNHDQYKVFNDPNDMHPTHSFISKDHFNVILNEPAGMIAQLVIRHAVEDVVKAWSNTSIDANQVVENILPVLHHPYFSRGHPIQNEMEQCMRRWIDGEDKNYVVPALAKDAVRNHKNHRKGHPTEEVHGPGGYTSFLPTPASIGHQASGYVQQQLNHVPGYQQFHNTFPTAFGRREMSDQPGGSQYGGQVNDPHQTYTGEPVISYGGENNAYPSSGGYDNTQQAYGHNQQSYGGTSYGQQNDPYTQHGSQSYGQQQGGFDQNIAYGNQQYGGQQHQSGYGNNDPYQQQQPQGRW